MFPLRPRLASFFALLLISVIGVVLVLRATPQGLGLSDDSIAYIAGARSMAAVAAMARICAASCGTTTLRNMASCGPRT